MGCYFRLALTILLIVYVRRFSFIPRFTTDVAWVEPLGLRVSIEECVSGGLRAVQPGPYFRVRGLQIRRLQRSNRGGLPKCFLGCTDVRRRITVYTQTKTGSTIRLAIRTDSDNRQVGINLVEKLGHAGQILGPRA
jgi:hypothetical protein